MAARNEHDAVVGLLLEKGANFEMKDKNGATALTWRLPNATVRWYGCWKLKSGGDFMTSSNSYQPSINTSGWLKHAQNRTIVV
jgi:ankyrin repeat protein